MPEFKGRPGSGQLGPGGHHGHTPTCQAQNLQDIIIVPVGITGTEDEALLGNLKKLRRGYITVTAGPIFTLPPLPRENRDEALKLYTDEIMCHIAALLPEKYRGVYANHPKLKELLQK